MAPNQAHNNVLPIKKIKTKWHCVSNKTRVLLLLELVSSILSPFWPTVLAVVATFSLLDPAFTRIQGEHFFPNSYSEKWVVAVCVHIVENVLYGYFPDIEYCEWRLSYTQELTTQNHTGHPNVKSTLLFCMGTFLILKIVNEGCLIFRYSLLKTILVILTSKERCCSVLVLSWYWILWMKVVLYSGTYCSKP